MKNAPENNGVPTHTANNASSLLLAVTATQAPVMAMIVAPTWVSTRAALWPAIQALSDFKVEGKRIPA